MSLFYFQFLTTIHVFSGMEQLSDHVNSHIIPALSSLPTPTKLGSLTIFLFLFLVFCIMTSQEKTEEYPFADIFSEDEIERHFLLSKPVCFAVFGKPVSHLF